MLSSSEITGARTTRASIEVGRSWIVFTALSNLAGVTRSAAVIHLIKNKGLNLGSKQIIQVYPEEAQSAHLPCIASRSNQAGRLG